MALGEFGRSPQPRRQHQRQRHSADGRDHWPYRYTAVVAAGISCAPSTAKAIKRPSAPIANPVHPIELLATIYHAVGINPQTIVYNHLNQPRELVKADPVTKLFG